MYNAANDIWSNTSFFLSYSVVLFHWKYINIKYLINLNLYIYSVIKYFSRIYKNLLFHLKKNTAEMHAPIIWKFKKSINFKKD